MSNESKNIDNLANALSQLNPSASEFVPVFTSPQAHPVQNYQNNHHNYQQPQPHHNNNRNYNNNGYSNNNYHNNHHNNNNNNNNSYRHKSNGYNNNNNNNWSRNTHAYQHNPNDVDPIELEARCEAVIEILGDEKIREHLNPVSQYGNDPDSAVDSNKYNDHFEEEPCEDEEEMMEMMAMQEECRLEMMKFYVQSQNPKLFEEIYHDVSYPDNKLKELRASNESAAVNQIKSTTTTTTDSSSEPPQSSQQQQKQFAKDEKSLKELILSKMNPEAHEFTPNKYSSASK